MKQPDALTAIERLSDLPEGWDSYGAPRIEEAARKRAKECLHQVRSVLGQSYWNPLVGPTPDAGVSLIWRKPVGSEVNVLTTQAGARYVVLSPTHHVVQTGQGNDFYRFSLEVLKPLEL